MEAQMSRHTHTVPLDFGYLGEKDVTVTFSYTARMRSPTPRETPDDPAEIRIRQVACDILSEAGLDSLSEALDADEDFLDELLNAVTAEADPE